MPDRPAATTPTRRRRSDARRSAEAILGAARRLLEQKPDASMEEIASAAGLTRQTVYAHFPSRDRLVGAIIDQAGAEAVTALDAADLDALAPTDALVGFLEIGWQALRRYLPLLLNSTAAHPGPSGPGDSHGSVTARLEEIVRRGQHSGEFEASLPASWLTDAILRMGHTAAEHEAANRLSASQTSAVLCESALRLCGASVANGRDRRW